ncbi:hypothetical protein GCM10025868_03510 [Angustibacter aerolatus]|uniref:Guanylate kinase-like domain-containing protein n=1 Tax=Angustibacter aerolatus TaxID=1162965 RepID=A0ABQ6JE92_9ACTN|nr:hypothetical protein GCM10025868_03510 [Angustibacter aerolatus]
MLAGPTAVGKGTVSATVRARFPQIWLSVSATTRPPRPGETDGVHYLFVDDDRFDEMVAAGEPARVGGRAPARPVRHPAAPGRGGAGGRPAGAARDRPAGCPAGARLDARCAVRLPRAPVVGRAWCAAWWAGAPRRQRSASAG